MDPPDGGDSSTRPVCLDPDAARDSGANRQPISGGPVARKRSIQTLMLSPTSTLQLPRTTLPIQELRRIARHLPSALNLPLSSLSAAFAYLDRGVGVSNPFPARILSPLCFHILTNCFSRNSFVLITIRIARGCHPRTALSSLLLGATIVY
jgi:hypothetical protein